MDLRRHPGMSFHGLRNWPPVWVSSRGDGQRNMRGEVGVLRYVHASNRISRKCYLVIEHEGSKYIGCLIFNDPSFCYTVSMLLRAQVGRTIEEIGGLDVSHLL
jgi:hypothetical protein